MTDVLTAAAPDDQVLRVGQAVAAALGARLRTLPQPETVGAEATALLRALGNRTALAAVLRPRPSGWEVVEQATKPVVLVPPGVRSRIERVLAPLDGSPEAAAAMGDASRYASDDLLVLHVFEPQAVPRFWDQAAHAGTAWGEEFLARWCERSDARLALRDGIPADRVVEVARDEQADLIVLGWSRRLDRDRAATVRQTVAAAHVPVLLVPVDVAAVGSGLNTPPMAVGPRREGPSGPTPQQPAPLH